MEIGKFKLAKADLVRPPKKPVQEQIIPKEKPYTKEVFQTEVEPFIKGFIGGFPKNEMTAKLQSILDKAVEKGALSVDEGTTYMRDRKQQLLDFVEQNPGQTLPELTRENFAIGGGVIKGEDLGTREGFKVIELSERYANKPGKGFFKNKLASEIPLETLKEIPGFIRTTTEGVVFDTLKNAEKFSKSDAIKNFKKSRMESRAQASAISRRMENRNPALFNKIIELAEEGKTSVMNIGRDPEVLKLNEGKTVDYDNIRQIVTRTKGKEFFDKMSDVKQYYKSPTRTFLEENLDDLMNDYYDGMSTTKLTKKYLPDSPDAIKNTSNTTLSEIVNENKNPERFLDRPIIVGSNQKGSRSEQIESLNDFQKYLSKNINKFSSKAGAEQNLKGLFDGSKIDTLGNFISKTNILRRMYNSKNLPKNFKINENVKNFIKYLPAQDFVESELRALGYSEKTIRSMKSVQNAVSDVTEAQTMFEHALPRSLIKSFNLPRKYNLVGERTSNFLNKFKMQFDGQLKNAAMAYAESDQTPKDYKEYKNKVNDIRNTVRKLTGGYEIGYVDFDKNGKAIPVTPQSSMLKGEGELGKRTTGIKNFFKNVQFHNNLYKNYKKNPNDKNFYTLNDEIKNSKVSFVPEPEIEKEYNKIKNFNKVSQFQDYFNKAPESSFFKSLFKGKGGKIGLASAIAAGGVTLPTLLSAEESTLGMAADGKETFDPEKADPTLKTAASAYGVYKYGPQLLKLLGNVGKGTVRAVASPAVAGGAAVSELMSEDPSQALAGAQLLYPEIIRQASDKGVDAAKGISGVKRFADKFKVGYDKLLALSPNLKYAPMVSKGMSGLGTLMIGADVVQGLGKRIGPDQRGPLTEQELLDMRGKETYMGNIADTFDKAYQTRTGFADGPEDPSKRKFMKIMGGLASLPIVGRFFDIAPVVYNAAEDAAKIIKGAPPHFMGLVNKIRALGKIVEPEKLMPSDQKRYSNVYDYGDYRMYEGKDGQIEIAKDKFMATDYGDAKVSEEYMSYNPKSPKIGKKGELTGETEPQYDEYTAYADQEGKMKDVVDGVEPSTIDEGTYSKEELEQLIIEQVEQNLKKGKK